jgi:hypothetical protein
MTNLIMPLPFKNSMCIFWKRITTKRRSQVSSPFMLSPERFVQSYFRPWILKLIISLIFIRFIKRLEGYRLLKPFICQLWPLRFPVLLPYWPCSSYFFISNLSSRTRSHQWRTQEFFSGGGGGVQQNPVRTERTGIWGRQPPSQGFWRQL